MGRVRFGDKALYFLHLTGIIPLFRCFWLLTLGGHPTAYHQMNLGSEVTLSPFRTHHVMIME